jgi:hypothetical protein
MSKYDKEINEIKQRRSETPQVSKSREDEHSRADPSRSRNPVKKGFRLAIAVVISRLLLKER